MKSRVILLILGIASRALAQTIEPVTISPVSPEGFQEVTWPAYSGSTYYLQTSPDLINWTVNPSYVIGDDMLHGIVIGNAKELFAQVVSFQGLPTDDNDGDGLTNDQETTSENRTDPNLADSDGDGATDGEEAAAGTDPNDPESSPAFVVEITVPPIEHSLQIFLDENLAFLGDNSAQVSPLPGSAAASNAGDPGSWHVELWDTAITRTALIDFRRFPSAPSPRRLSLLNVREVWLTDDVGADPLSLEIPTDGLQAPTLPAMNDPLPTYGGYGTWSLVRVDFVLDWNRDGTINDEDRGKATDENPFVFWINDDNDENEEPHFGDIPGQGIDNADDVVNGERDLVDFFPVQLRIEKLLEVLPPAEYSYRVSHPTGAVNFIEMPDVQPDSQRINGAGSYLADQSKAADAMARPLNDTAGNGTELTAEYLNAVENGMGVLLFESVAATNQSFELVISKKSDNSEMARIPGEGWMNLVPVEHMFWYSSIREALEPDFELAAIEIAQNDRFRNSRKDRWFVFCHGYNVSEEAARGWNAETFKRLHQMGSDSKFLGVTWEGNQGQIGGIPGLFATVTPDYWHNAYNAFKSSAALAMVVNSQSGKKVIAGHSLGNMLVSSAICDQGLNAEQYFLLNAAVAREAYSAAHVNTDRNLVRHPDWADHATRLWSTDYWTLFPADDERRKLTWQGRFSDLAANTTPHNYYSLSEDVLKSGDGTKPNLFTDVTIRSQLAWVKQEMGKGEFTKKLVTGVHQANGGWAFNNFWGGNPPVQNEPLKVDPYFKPFTEFFDQNGQNPESIHGPNGSAIAGQYPIRSFLLGHDVPAISNPAGSNEVDGFSADPDETNTDMPTELKSGNWGDWQHSDLKNEPMGRVWKLFSNMVSRGQLNLRYQPPPTN